jgi:hypothetical protein
MALVATVHYHCPEKPPANAPFGRWACGALFGQATGEKQFVTCEECKASDEFKAEQHANPEILVVPQPEVRPQE